MKTRDMILIGIFAALTAVGAFIKIPIPYLAVPMTLQFLFCAYGGILLGAKKGAAAQLIYILLGLTGIPVFAEGGGPGYIFKPTFGYLLGFVACAYCIGFIVERCKTHTFPKLLGAASVGLIVLYTIGAGYLYMIMNLYLHFHKSAYWAFQSGVVPFIGKDFGSCIFVAFTGMKVLPVLKKVYSN